MSFNLIVFLLGAAGGAVAELAKWFEITRQSDNAAVYAKSPTYWIVTGLMALAGGLLAVLYGLDASKGLLALNIGISAPMIIKSLAANVIAPPGGKGLDNPQPSVINFLAGR